MNLRFPALFGLIVLSVAPIVAWGCTSGERPPLAEPIVPFDAAALSGGDSAA